MKDTKGFTLVELLAVIVILGIIMIIAIPSVLQTMTTAQQKSFLEYMQKVYNVGIQKYIEDSTINGFPSSAQEVSYIYDISKDLGLASTGDYHGYFMAYKCTNETACPKTKYYQVFLWNDEYFYSLDDSHDGFNPKEEELVSISSIIDKYNVDISSINTVDGLKFISSMEVCNTLQHDYIDAGTRTIVASTPAHPNAWLVNPECENSWEYLKQ